MATRRTPAAHFQPFMKYEVGEVEEDVQDYEDEELDDTTAQLLTPQVRLDVAQRRKPNLQHQRVYEDAEADDCYDTADGCQVDLVFMEDNDGSFDQHEIKPKVMPSRVRSHKRQSSQSSGSGGSGGGGSRPKKMYELDTTLYPEAAAARASYENRLRKKAEKEEMVRQLNFYRERNKVLEEENEALKDKLLEYELNVSREDWIQFFRAAGIRSGHEERYANIFDENRMKPNMLNELNDQWLRNMDITAVGDILAILRHAQLVYAKTNGRKLHYKSPPLLHRAPTAPAAKPTLHSISANLA